jgi:hypothetical protein
LHGGPIPWRETVDIEELNRVSLYTSRDNAVLLRVDTGLLTPEKDSKKRPIRSKKIPISALWARRSRKRKGQRKRMPRDETETLSAVVPESQAARVGGDVAEAYRASVAQVFLGAISNNMDPLVASSFADSMRAEIVANAAQNVDTILEAIIILRD